MTYNERLRNSNTELQNLLDDVENLPSLPPDDDLQGYLKTSDIVDNLDTDAADKPLSAAQGVELKRLISELDTFTEEDKTEIINEVLSNFIDASEVAL